MNDVLNDALSNLEHDNYERSHKGYENRQADVAMIRAALAAQPAASAEPSDALSENEWYDLAQRHATRDWNGNGYMAAIQAVCLDFLSRYGRPAGEAQPVAWVAADTLNSPHPKSISSLAYMSQIDQDRGREYVPLYAAQASVRPPQRQARRHALDDVHEAVPPHPAQRRRRGV